MKIRTGFVSNSSSSSFTMVGVRIEHEAAKSMAAGFGKILSLPEDSDLSVMDMIEMLGRPGTTYEKLRLRYMGGMDYIFGISVSYGDDLHKTPICQIVENAQQISQFLQDFERLYGLPEGIEKTPSLFSGQACC